MGIKNKVLVFYGTVFEYFDIEHLKADDDDILPDIWRDLGFIAVEPYYDIDEDYWVYAMGKILPEEMTAQEAIEAMSNVKEVEKTIRAKCKKLDITDYPPHQIQMPAIPGLIHSKNNLKNVL